MAEAAERLVRWLGAAPDGSLVDVAAQMSTVTLDGADTAGALLGLGASG